MIILSLRNCSSFLQFLLKLLFACLIEIFDNLSFYFFIVSVGRAVCVLLLPALRWETVPVRYHALWVCVSGLGVWGSETLEQRVRHDRNHGQSLVEADLEVSHSPCYLCKCGLNGDGVTSLILCRSFIMIQNNSFLFY